MLLADTSNQLDSSFECRKLAKENMDTLLRETKSKAGGKSLSNRDGQDALHCVLIYLHASWQILFKMLVTLD